MKNLKVSRKKVHMLDIGTGTGLLAMMAVQSGADRATACEVSHKLTSSFFFLNAVYRKSSSSLTH